MRENEEAASLLRKTLPRRDRRGYRAADVAAAVKRWTGKKSRHHAVTGAATGIAAEVAVAWSENGELFGPARELKLTIQKRICRTPL